MSTIPFPTASVLAYRNTDLVVALVNPALPEGARGSRTNPGRYYNTDNAHRSRLFSDSSFLFQLNPATGHWVHVLT